MDHNRAASYTRVFTDDTLTAGHQAEAIRRLADALGMTIVREYEDEEHGSGPGRNADPSAPSSCTTAGGSPRARPTSRSMSGSSGTPESSCSACGTSRQGAPRRPRSRRSGRGGRPEGPGEPAPAGSPTTWPPTQPSFRAEQPASPNTPPPSRRANTLHRRDGRPRHPRPENTRAFSALRPGDTNPPERAKESAMQTNGVNGGHQHEVSGKRVNPAIFPYPLDMELCACGGSGGSTCKADRPPRGSSSAQGDQ